MSMQRKKQIKELCKISFMKNINELSNGIINPFTMINKRGKTIFLFQEFSFH